MKPVNITEKFTSRESDAFKLYLKEISAIPLFAPEEEMACAIKSAAGDEKATQELIRRNLRFVVSVAKTFVNNECPLEDLVNEGNAGLVEAAKRFNPSLDNKFISYAVWWIRKNILDFKNKTSRFIYVPSNKSDELNAYSKKIAILEKELGRPVDITELLSAADMDQKEISMMQEIHNTSIWDLDRPMGEDEGSTLHDMLADTSVPRTDHLLVDGVFEKQIQNLISSLPQRDAQVIRMIFGFDGYTPIGLTEIGDNLGVSREMVRQIRNRTLKQLRTKIEKSKMFN